MDTTVKKPTTLTDFTLEEKLKEVEREIGQRRRVYPRLVSRGTISQRIADRQTAIMLAIAADYRKKISEGPLFNTEQSL